MAAFVVRRCVIFDVPECPGIDSWTRKRVAEARAISEQEGLPIGPPLRRGAICLKKAICLKRQLGPCICLSTVNGPPGGQSVSRPWSLARVSFLMPFIMGPWGSG